MLVLNSKKKMYFIFLYMFIEGMYILFVMWIIVVMYLVVIKEVKGVR